MSDQLTRETSTDLCTPVDAREYCERRRTFLASALQSTILGFGMAGVIAALASCEKMLVAEYTIPDPDQGKVFAELVVSRYPRLAEKLLAISISVEGQNEGLPILIARIDDLSFKAYSAMCPHQGALIEPNEPGRYPVCTAHGYEYDLQTGDRAYVGSPQLFEFPTRYLPETGVLRVYFG